MSSFRLKPRTAFVILAIFVVVLNANDTCPPGTMISHISENGHVSCKPCPEGAFNDKYDQYGCEDCIIVDEDHVYQEVVIPCTPTSDTQVKCRDPLFFYVPHLKKCQVCWHCKDAKPYEAATCTDYNDTVCCEKPGMFIRDGLCTMPVFCSVNEYLVSRGAEDGRHDECRPCPLNSTNYEAKHWKQACDVSCVEAGIELQADTVGRTECKGDEYEVGNHCKEEGVVLCAPNPAPSDVNVPCPVKEDSYAVVSHVGQTTKPKNAIKSWLSRKGKDQESDGSIFQHLGLAAIVFGVTIVALIVVIYSCSLRERRIHTVAPQAQETEV